MHFSICPEMMIYFGESRNACKKTLMLYNILQKKYFRIQNFENDITILNQRYQYSCCLLLG